MSERDVELVRGINQILHRATDLPGEGLDTEEPSNNADPGWCKALVIGAGGLGCELLKCMALSGFVEIDVIDMDTIDLSNLNRQFLFRESDIGKAKADVAARFIQERCPWMKVTPHHGKIQDKPDSFYQQFHIIILGLDSIGARQWMNELVSRIMYVEPDIENNKVTVMATPLIDGGTEGFKGHSRVIKMGQTACFECTVDLFPPQTKIPMCTLENIPRQPEHCVMYVMQASWDREKPFDGAKLDGDEESHVLWVAERAAARAAKFNIPGEFDFQFTQGVMKNVIPALASSNAIIASQCINEALKIVTGMSNAMDNYYTFNGGSDLQGCFGTLQQLVPSYGCHVCQPTLMRASKSWTPSMLCENALHGFMKESCGESDDAKAEISQLYARINPGPGSDVIEYNLMLKGLLASKTESLQSVPVYESMMAKLRARTDEEGAQELSSKLQLQVDCPAGSRRVLVHFE
eukprot:PhM_4_TR19113/c0_g1_i1/m.63548/K10686/UBE1C, UBA3; ubiquitin-activating enzyme E1 C